MEEKAATGKFKGDRVIWTVFFFLCIISIIEVFSASSNLSFKSGNYLGPVLKHVMLLVVGVMAMIATMNVKCKYFKMVTPGALIISFIGLIAVLCFGESTNGSQRWLSVMGIQFQPSELAKGAIILATAQILSAMQTPTGADKRAFKYICIVCAFIVPLIMVENLSTAVLLCTVVFLLMFIGKVPKAQLGRLLGIVMLCLIFIVSMVMILGHDKEKENADGQKMAMTEQVEKKDETVVEKVFHRFDTWKARIDKFLDNKEIASEDVDLDKDGQTAHANIAIASSNVVGKGPGNSVERDFLSQAFSDFIYAIIIEEMGIAGAVRMPAVHHTALPHGNHSQPLCQHFSGASHHGLCPAARHPGHVQHGCSRRPCSRHRTAASADKQGRNVNHSELCLHRNHLERKLLGQEERRGRRHGRD